MACVGHAATAASSSNSSSSSGMTRQQQAGRRRPPSLAAPAPRQGRPRAHLLAYLGLQSGFSAACWVLLHRPSGHLCWRSERGIKQRDLPAFASQALGEDLSPDLDLWRGIYLDGTEVEAADITTGTTGAVKDGKEESPDRKY